MQWYDDIKEKIASIIKLNGHHEFTGPALQSVLNDFVVTPIAKHITQIYELFNNTLRKTEQALTDAEKIQIQENIGVGKNGVSEELIARWKTRWRRHTTTGTIQYGNYDSSTGYFTIGSHRFTAEEAREALEAIPSGAIAKEDINPYYQVWWVKAAFVYMPISICMAYMFRSCSNLEVIIFSNANSEVVSAKGDCYSTFHGCNKLTEIIGIIDISGVTTSLNMFTGCTSLREVKLRGLKTGFQLAGVPEISLDSMAYLIDNALNTAPIVIQIHSTTLARLTDELIARAAEKQIRFYAPYSDREEI